MKRSSLSRIDKLLSQLGLRPDVLDPEEYTAGSKPANPPTPLQQTGPCGKCCYSSEPNCRKAGNIIKSRGANTSFFRPYFCPQCKKWHLTSTKNPTSNPSSTPNRNAGHKRRNHHRPSSADEP